MLRETYGLAVTGLTPVSGGADHRARTFRATTAAAAGATTAAAAGATTAAAYAVRISSEPAVAPGVLDLLTRSGLAGVPTPRRTRSGALSTPVAGGHLTVLDWVDGVADTAAELTPDQWTALGRLLRRVHDTDPALAPHSLPTGTFDLGWYDQTLAAVRRGLAATDRPEIVALRSVWVAATDRIDAVLARLHHLAAMLRPTRPCRVLCHTDPHLGNVVLDREGEVHLIDWDDAAHDPVERDLMFVLGGVIANRPVAAREQGWFFVGYGPAMLGPELVTWFRGRRAIEDLALPALEILRGTRPPTDLAGELEIIRGVLAPTGLVDQTLTG